jgi:cellobiose phosphorylase
MGCGDWNDGMNLVGIEGKGESVWLAFFLYHVLEKFEKCCELQQDEEFIQVMRQHRETVKQNIEKEAWDGAWYRRAFFDNGEPLGSSQNDECQIDSLPQSWGVISGAADQTRVLQGLKEANSRLVRKDLKLIQLFDPAFEKSHLNPGYIKGYAPGVRENGGQYTHAAIWMVWAYTLLRENRKAWELFDVLNPVNHTLTRKDLDTYRVEPYVVAADVYTLKGHEGHGGWTWYTGSAGWMYRLIIEQLLGIHKSGDYLVLKPCPRPDWKEYKVHYRFGKSIYHISFVRAAEATKSSSMLITVDGVEAHYSDKVHLIDDNSDHNVQVHLL